MTNSWKERKWVHFQKRRTIHCAFSHWFIKKQQSCVVCFWRKHVLRDRPHRIHNTFNIYLILSSQESVCSHWGNNVGFFSSLPQYFLFSFKWWFLSEAVSVYPWQCGYRQDKRLMYTWISSCISRHGKCGSGIRVRQEARRSHTAG